MVDRRLQRGYNWAYSVVSGAVRMLPFMMRAGHTEKASELSKPLNGFLPMILESSRQFDKLADETGDSLYRNAAVDLGSAATSLQAALESAASPDRADFRRDLQATIDMLQTVKGRLDRESPIRYGLWMLNPIRHFPTKLA